MTEFSGAPDDQLPPMPDIPQQLLPAVAALGGLMREHHPNILLDAFVAAVPTEIMADYLAAQPRELLTATLKKLSSDRLSEVLNELPGPETTEVKDILAENEDLAILLRHVGKLNDPTTVAQVALANLAGNQRNRAIAELGRVELGNALSWLDGDDQAWVRDGLADGPVAEITDEEILRDALAQTTPVKVAAVVEPSTRLSLIYSLLGHLAYHERATVVADSPTDVIVKGVRRTEESKRKHILRELAEPDSEVDRHILVDENSTEFHTQSRPPTGLVRHITRQGHPTLYKRDHDIPPITEVGPGGRNVVLHIFTEVKS